MPSTTIKKAHTWFTQDKWCQGGTALNLYHHPVQFWADDALFFDIVGALKRTYIDPTEFLWDRYIDASNKVHNIIRDREKMMLAPNLAKWNDMKVRTWNDVISALTEADV